MNSIQCSRISGWRPHSLDEVIDKFSKIVSNITNILRTVSTGMLVMLMALGAADVIGRYLLNKPIKGVYGLSEILLVGIVFFAWPYTQSVGGNVKVETFFYGFSHRVQSSVGSLISIIGIVIFGLMAWQSAIKAIDSWEMGEIVDVVRIPVYPFQFFVTIGVTALCLELTVDLVHFLRGKKR